MSYMPKSTCPPGSRVYINEIKMVEMRNCANCDRHKSSEVLLKDFVYFSGKFTLIDMDLSILIWTLLKGYID